MTWEEICQQYAGQWVLMHYHALDEHLHVISGEVVAHSPVKEEISRQQLQTTGQNIALEYAGALPQELAAMFHLGPDTPWSVWGACC
jgi:hypothetical protein